MTTRTNHRRAPNGFTLTEAAAGVAGLALLAALALPAFEAVRTDARLTGSVSNLAILGKANAAYGEANDGLISGYDWDVYGGPFGESRYDIGGGVSVTVGNTLEAAQTQQAAIIRRATGRFSGPEAIELSGGWMPHRRYSHLPLLDWLGGDVSGPIAVSPLDAHQQAFQQAPLEYESLPGGDPDAALFSGLGSPQILNRWPFASSYQTTVYAWSPSRYYLPDLPLQPASNGTSIHVYDPDAFGPQPLSDVVYPSAKAHYFEEFDYRSGLGANGRYFADPQASVNVLFFDGRAGLAPVAAANPGWDPDRPCNMTLTTEVEFEPLDSRYFPTYPAGENAFNGPFRWTRGGLEGIDISAPEINSAGWCD